MPNTTSVSLKLTVQATGENSGTWGQITNTNLLILEQAIGGYDAVGVTSGATLAFTNGALSNGKNQVLKLTGTIAGNVDVIVPDSVEKTYVVENATSGAFTVTVKTTSGSGVTWGTTDKGKKLIYSDGTNILEGISSTGNLEVSGNLDVDGGTIKLDGNYPVGTNNVALGDGALDDGSLTGASNTAIGTNALTANTTGYQNTAVGLCSLVSNTTGPDNVAVGWCALASNISGCENTTVGSFSLKGNTTGCNNVAIGRRSLQSNTTSNDNTAVGFASLCANTTGCQNVALGTNALLANTTAVGNTAVGTNSLCSNTTGFNNTAVGNCSGNDVTTGDCNTYIGAFAGYQATTGNNNTGVGDQALSLTTTASDNTAVGRSALKTNTTGAENTALGFQALAANVSSAGNVAIGYNSQYLATGARNTSIGSASFPAALTGEDNTGVGIAAGISLTSGSNNLLLGHDAGRSGSPGGVISTQSNRIVLGDENISDAHIQVDWTVVSDQRDKTDFNNLNLGLDFVNKLNPVTYKWDKRIKYVADKDKETVDLNTIVHDGTHKEDWLDIGFKAQEVEALEKASGYDKDTNTNLIVTITEDGKQYGLQYSKFVPILVNAIKELKAEIDILKNK
jgi:trimeric autotransporter adhesin